MLYFLNVPIEGWLVEHPKIKIKSSIILNYGVNVQYAYSVKCDIFENIVSKGIEHDVFHVNVKQHTYL
jgi:hypothetical protein